MTPFYCLKFESPQLGGPDCGIYFPQEQGDPVTSPGIAFLSVEVEVNLRPTVSRPVHVLQSQYSETIQVRNITLELVVLRFDGFRKLQHADMPHGCITTGLADFRYLT
jgi:hypothetical protein